MLVCGVLLCGCISSAVTVMLTCRTVRREKRRMRTLATRKLRLLDTKKDGVEGQEDHGIFMRVNYGISTVETRAI